ncbi:MAG: ShlB/FhaC/HecB family hemolysin secretion/activation protein [bacterium]
MLGYRLNLKVFYLACILFFSSSCTYAQVLPPANLNAGAATKTNQNFIEKHIKESVKENDANIKPISDIEPAKPVEGKIEAIDNSIFIEKIIVENCELLTKEEINNIISKYEKKNLTINDLKAIVREINNIYIDYGILTALAYLPPQDITGNTVKIKVIEGKVGKIEVLGNNHTRKNYIKGALHQKEGDIIFLPELKDDILSFNRSNDVKLKARITKGKAFGTSDIIINAEELNPYHLLFSFDNTGRENIGILKYGATVQHDSLLGYRDRLTVSYGRAKTTDVVSTSYSLPIGHKGLRVGGSFGYGGIAISSGILKPLDIEGKSFSYSVFANKPIINTPKFSLSSNTGFNFKKVTTFIQKRPLSEVVVDSPSTQVRSLVFSLAASERDKTGQWAHTSDFHTGFDILGGKESFFKYTGDLTRLQSLGKGHLLILRAATQLTGNELPPCEQFQIGGSSSVRGYSEGLLIGDKGYLFSGEWRFPLKFLPTSIGKLRIKDNFQGAFFAETGAAFPKNYVRSRQTATSVGIGLRTQVTKYVSAKVDYGFGLVNRTSDQPVARLHFGLEAMPF